MNRGAFIAGGGLSAIALGVALTMFRSNAVWFAAAIAAAPVILLVAYRRPSLVLSAFLLAPAFKSALGLPVDLTVLLGVVLAVAAGRELIGHVRVPLRWEVVCLLGLGVFLLVGSLWSEAPSYGIDKAFRYATLGVVALCAPAVFVARDRQFVSKIAVDLTVTATLVALACVVNGGDPTEYGRLSLGAGTIHMGRVGALAVLGGLAALVWSARRMWIWVSALTLGSVALVGSGSRGPVVGLALGILAVALARFSVGAKRSTRLMLGIIALVSVGALAWSFSPSSATDRFALLFSEDKGYSIDQRGELAELALEIIGTHPILGIGTGSFANHSTYDYPHNLVLEVWAENGFFAVALAVTALGAALRKSIVAARRSRSYETEYLLLGVVVFLANAMVSTDINGNRILFALAATVCAYLPGGSRQDEEPCEVESVSA